MDILISSLMRILEGMPYLALLVFGLFGARFFFRITSDFSIDEELTGKDNSAFGVYLGGYLFGTGIALTGAMHNTGMTLVEDIYSAGISIIATILLMRLSVLVNDRLILFKFSVVKEVSGDRNIGTGFVVAGSSVATGLMLNGILSGTSESWWLTVRDIAVYWALGQFLLILGGLLFEWVTKFNVHEVIEKQDNIPAGIAFGGWLAAIGVLIRSSLAGATSNIGEEIVITLVFALCGILLLVPTTVIVDRILLPKSPLTKEIVEDKNPAAGIIAAASFIVVALIFTAAASPH